MKLTNDVTLSKYVLHEVHLKFT